MDPKNSTSLATRRLALQMLMRVERGAHLDALLGSTVESLDDRREAAFLTKLGYGVETWRKRLDWTLQAFARDPLDRLEPAVRGALRLGLFQLLFLDRVPQHAAVDTSVTLAKEVSPAGARVVNAILRRTIREGEMAPPADTIESLSVRYSHPEWLVDRWLEERGRERTEALLAANNEASPSAFRIDLRRVPRKDALDQLRDRAVVAHPSPYVESALTIEGPVGKVADLGWLHPQGVASQIVAGIVGAGRPARIADLCAAPGGKAAALAEMLETSTIIACDLAARGVARTARQSEGRPGLTVVRADARHPPLAPESFDTALVDAPCSGFGTLRSHPEVRWRRGPDDVTRLASLQRELLDRAATLVRPGGQLIYATCTLVAEENQSNIEQFLRNHPHWSPMDPRPGIGAAARFVEADQSLRTSPDLDGLDGFFAIALRNDSKAV